MVRLRAPPDGARPGRRRARCRDDGPRRRSRRPTVDPSNGRRPRRRAPSTLGHDPDRIAQRSRDRVHLRPSLLARARSRAASSAERLGTGSLGRTSPSTGSRRSSSAANESWPTAGPTWCSATSRSAGRTSCGSPTCPTCAAGRGWCSSASCSTPTAARWWAGSWRPTCAPHWSSTRSRWRSATAGPAPTSRSSITPIAAVNPDSTGRRNSVRGVNLSIRAVAVSELAPQRPVAG